MKYFSRKGCDYNLEKKDKDKRFIKNWSPISLFNTDVKIISKVLSKRKKGVLPYLISTNQTAFFFIKHEAQNSEILRNI